MCVCVCVCVVKISLFMILYSCTHPHYSLAIDGQITSCTCDSDLRTPADPDTLTVLRSNVSILIQQSASGSHSNSDFEALLRQISFYHDPTRPDVNSYSAFVRVTASDGELTSPVATTEVIVSLINEAPVVLVDGEVHTLVQPVCDN